MAVLGDEHERRRLGQRAGRVTLADGPLRRSALTLRRRSPRPRAAPRTRTCCLRPARWWRRSFRPSSRRAGRRSSGRGRCRRSGARSSCRPARTAGTAGRGVSASIPMPVSVTSIRTTRRSSPATVAPIRTVTLPSAVNLTAFETRLMTTWRIRAASPRSQAGSSPSATTSSSIALRARDRRAASRSPRRPSRAARSSRLELDLAGLHLRVVEDVVDDQQQALAGGARRSRRTRAAGRRAAVSSSRLGHPDHAVERRAQLVADGRDEHRLRVRGLDRLVARERVGLGGGAHVAERDQQADRDAEDAGRGEAEREQVGALEVVDDQDAEREQAERDRRDDAVLRAASRSAARPA